MEQGPSWPIRPSPPPLPAPANPNSELNTGIAALLVLGSELGGDCPHVGRFSLITNVGQVEKGTVGMRWGGWDDQRRN